MPRYEKKPQVCANLVKRIDEEYYRVLDDVEMRALKNKGKVRPEGRMNENARFIVSYYIEVE